MEINSQHVDGFLEVRAAGRLDAYWSDHLSQALEEMLRQGDDRIRLHLGGVEYISSMGIRVLVSFYRKVAGINGAFLIVEPSEPVGKVLEMVGLKETLMAGRDSAAADAFEQVCYIERESGRMDVFPIHGSSPMNCKVVGDPALLDAAGFSAEHGRSAVFPENTFGLGLGAFGANFAECRERFGEFLAVDGAAAYQPSDGSNAPDYLLAQGSFVPELQMLYGIVLEGGFERLGRFEVNGDARAVGLSTFAEMALEAAEVNQAAFVMVGESAGLVGASLRKSPIGGGAAVFAHPEIRNWLSFTTERAFTRALAVCVGVISRKPSSALAPFLRPLHGEGSLHGHIHAAAFPYRPMQRGRIDLRKTIRSLFEQETLLGMLHLLGDDRESTGVAESEFVRGACWVAPLDKA
jgi:anti-anti-sigma factor